MAVFDLHLHTCWSYDGFSRAADYFRFAEQKKVRAIAVTDHHLMDSCGEVLRAAAEYPEVGYILGAELTVHCPLGTYDLVCLNLPVKPDPGMAAVFERYRQWQVACGQATSRNYCKLGFPFDDAARLKLLQSYRPAEAIARQGITHVRSGNLRDYCIEHGFCRDEAEFKAQRQNFTDMPNYPEYNVVVPAVKKAGGVVIIAHPYGYFLKNDRNRMDQLREMLQLDGIECAHKSVPPEMTPFYREYCREHGLLSSAGSDLHTPDPEKFAVHCGSPEWLDELLERVTLRHGA